MRTKRINISSPELDNTEQKWWDDNAQVIEKIWAQNIHFQNVIRLPYLAKMKAFFLEGNSKRPVKILEIGCGSGWVCRLVADKDFHVIGTDFSQGQLAIAHQNAKAFDKEAYCTYEQADASTFQKKDIDGVVIHALLHHLSTEELTNFFEQFAQLPSGTKIFMYEPVFFNRQAGEKSLRDKIINKLIYKLRNYSLARARKIGSTDQDLAKVMTRIDKDAAENGWYISPKEVPFYEGELERFVEPLCTLQKKYIVNKTDLDIAQELTLNSIDKPDGFFANTLIPLAIKLDELSFSGKFTHYMEEHQHLFVCFEWIKK